MMQIDDIIYTELNDMNENHLLVLLNII